MPLLSTKKLHGDHKIFGLRLPKWQLKYYPISRYSHSFVWVWCLVRATYILGGQHEFRGQVVHQATTFLKMLLRPEASQLIWWFLGVYYNYKSYAVTSLLTKGRAAFKWKLHCHWLIGLWHHQITVAIPSHGCQPMETYFSNNLPEFPKFMAIYTGM